MRDKLVGTPDEKIRYVRGKEVKQMLFLFCIFTFDRWFVIGTAEMTLRGLSKLATFSFLCLLCICILLWHAWSRCCRGNCRWRCDSSRYVWRCVRTSAELIGDTAAFAQAAQKRSVDGRRVIAYCVLTCKTFSDIFVIWIQHLGLL